MAKVQSPLFDDFKEAFADVIVFQRNRGSVIKVREKVKHPTDPTSAHRPGRSANWAQAVEDYDNNVFPQKTFSDIVALEAISPNKPTNLRRVTGYDSDKYNAGAYAGPQAVYNRKYFNAFYYQSNAVYDLQTYNSGFYYGSPFAYNLRIFDTFPYQ